MRMSFRSRGSNATIEPTRREPAEMIGTLTCSAASCSSTTAVPCFYIDRRGLACETAWCEQHRVVVDGMPLCRRHASVMLAIPEDERLNPPDRDNRAPSLLDWMARDLDPDIRSALDTVRLPGDHFTTEPAHLAHIGPQRIRAWVRTWKLMDHTGFSHWVAVDVPEVSQTEVAIRVDGVVVARAEPPWIRARRQGITLSPEEDAEERQRFRDGIIELVRINLREARRV